MGCYSYVAGTLGLPLKVCFHTADGARNLYIRTWIYCLVLIINFKLSMRYCFHNNASLLANGFGCGFWATFSEELGREWIMQASLALS
jgi:hypothetical protein